LFKSYLIKIILYMLSLFKSCIHGEEHGDGLAAQEAREENESMAKRRTMVRSLVVTQEG
jgi:hypothetical protein